MIERHPAGMIPSLRHHGAGARGDGPDARFLPICLARPCRCWTTVLVRSGLRPHPAMRTAGPGARTGAAAKGSRWPQAMLGLAGVGADRSEDQPPAPCGHRATSRIGGAIVPTGQLERAARVRLPVTPSATAVQAPAREGR